MTSSNNSPNANPWNSPFFSRPSVGMFNDVEKENDPNAQPPNPQTDPNAEEENTVKFLLVAMAQMIPSAEIGVLANSGGGAIGSVVSPNDAVNGNISAFSLTRNGPGDYTIEMGAGVLQLPANPNGASPRAWLVAQLGAHAYSIGAVYTVGTHGRLAVRVTTNQDTTPTDLNFSCVFR